MASLTLHRDCLAFVVDAVVVVISVAVVAVVLLLIAVLR